MEFVQVQINKTMEAQISMSVEIREIDAEVYVSCSKCPKAFSSKSLFEDNKNLAKSPMKKAANKKNIRISQVNHP